MREINSARIMLLYPIRFVRKTGDEKTRKNGIIQLNRSVYFILLVSAKCCKRCRYSSTCAIARRRHHRHHHQSQSLLSPSLSFSLSLLQRRSRVLNQSRSSGGIERNFSNASLNSFEVGTPCPPSCSNTIALSAS